jgi:hypothetical protein
MYKIKALLLKAAFALFITSMCLSCETDPLTTLQGGGIYNYSWGFINSSGADITHSEIYLGDQGHLIYLADSGRLPSNMPGIWRGPVSGSSENPIIPPDHIVIKWSDNNGIEHMQNISLAERIPPHNGSFKGRIWLRFFEGRWSATAFTLEQMRQQGAHAQD